MPIVMIEGCDGAGKTSLAEAILWRVVDYRSKRPDMRVNVEHYGVPKYDPESSLSIGGQAMNQLLMRPRVMNYNFFTDFLVLDRFHWGEPVYAPVFRPDRCVDPLFGTLTYPEFYYVEDWLQSAGAINVYASAPEEVILERIQRRGGPDLIGESDDSTERCRMILGRYDTLTRYISAPQRKAPTEIERVELLTFADTQEQAHRIVDLAFARSAALLETYLEKTTEDTPYLALARDLMPKLMEAPE